MQLLVKTIQETTHQEMRYPNVASLYFATPLAFNAGRRVPWDELSVIFVLIYFLVLVLVLPFICLSVSLILRSRRISNLLTKTC